MEYNIQNMNELINIDDFINFSSKIIIIGLILTILLLIELFFVFKKFNEKGWKAFIPFYNTWIFLELADLPGWLQFVPVANIIGGIVAPFILAKKAGKNPALGLVNLLSPYIFYLIIILSKKNNSSEDFLDNKQENNAINNEEINEDNNENNKEDIIINNEILTENNTNDIQNDFITEPNELDNDIKENTTEKVPEFIEEPALNTEDLVVEETNTLNNNYVSIENESKKVIDEDITNAFEIPPIINESEKTDTLDILSNQDTNNFINSGEPLMPTYEELESLDFNEEPTLDKDILEETVELPKMANVEINSDITATKKCNNCGFENIYSSKTCLMCGETLE